MRCYDIAVQSNLTQRSAQDPGYTYARSYGHTHDRVLDRALGHTQSRTSSGSAPHRARNLRIEALRILAIVGISVFHIALPWAWLITPDPAVFAGFADHLSRLAYGITAIVLGVLLQLGSFGNHIFFMISGLFTLPSLMRLYCAASGIPYWRKSMHRTAKKCAALVLSAALIGLFALLARACGVPLPNLLLLWQWTIGLEFIWVYAFFIVVSPVIAWLLAVVPRRVSIGILSVANVVIFACNGVVAFTSIQPPSGLADWRKWMGVLTYGVGFVWAGVLGASRALQPSQAVRAKRIVRIVLCAIFVILLAVQGIMLVTNPSYIVRLAYKSTSLFAFIMAFVVVVLASISPANYPGQSWQEACRTQSTGMSKSTTADMLYNYMPSSATPRTGIPHAARRATICSAMLSWLAPGILGYYIVQSVFSIPIMDRGITVLMQGIWAQAQGIGTAPTLCVMLILTIVCAVLYVGIVLVLDALTRQPILRRLHLL